MRSICCFGVRNIFFFITFTSISIKDRVQNATMLYDSFYYALLFATNTTLPGPKNKIKNKTTPGFN